jgi:capsid protein
MMRIGPFQFGYAAIEDKNRRKAPSRRVRHEQIELPQRNRDKLQATAQQQARDHSLVAWMVRKHLDYVSKFHVSFRTERDELDLLVNRIFKWHGHPRNLDFMGRFGRDEFFRLYEMEKVLCGDAGAIKLPDLKLQSLESDLICKGALPHPATATVKAEWETVNDAGLVVDNLGRPTGFSVCNRGPDGKDRVYDHIEPIDNVIYDAYWTRFGSQWRGVSPLSTAINTVADVHEAMEYNIIKAKMHALFGIAILRKADETGNGFGYGAGEQVPPDETPDPNTHAPDGSDKSLDPKTINMLDLEPGEDVKMLESGTPSSEFVEGTHLFMHVAMIALDIPITSFDSRRSSFSARIADLNEYEVACDSKRTKNRYVRQAYSDWVLESIWNDAASPWPLRKVASEAGFTRLRDLQEAVEWVPSGAPWLDKLKQIQGDELAISLALDNSIDAARRKGGNVFENIDKQAKVIEYARSKGVPIVTNRAGDDTTDDAPDPDEQERERNEP